MSYPPGEGQDRESQDRGRDQEPTQQQSGPQYGQPPPAPHPPYGEQPGYPPPGYPVYGRPSGTNIMAVLSLVFAFVFAPAGIVLGHIARRQIRETGEEGGQLATWGLGLSYAFTALYVLACCAGIGLIVIGATQSGNTNY